MQFWPHREQLLGEAISHVLRVIDFFVVVIARPEHHDGCPGNDDRKHHFDPWTQRQEAGTDGDEDAAEDDGADDAPVQNAVAQAIRNLEPENNAMNTNRLSTLSTFSSA